MTTMTRRVKKSGYGRLDAMEVRDRAAVRMEKLMHSSLSYYEFSRLCRQVRLLSSMTGINREQVWADLRADVESGNVGCY